MQKTGVPSDTLRWPNWLPISTVTICGHVLTLRIENEVVDGDMDCLSENPRVPKTVSIRPYWGPVTQVPDDRLLREEHGAALPPDVDVDGIWWPELEKWMDRELWGQPIVLSF